MKMKLQLLLRLTTYWFGLRLVKLATRTGASALSVPAARRENTAFVARRFLRLWGYWLGLLALPRRTISMAVSWPNALRWHRRAGVDAGKCPEVCWTYCHIQLGNKRSWRRARAEMSRTTPKCKRIAITTKWKKVKWELSAHFLSFP